MRFCLFDTQGNTKRVSQAEHALHLQRKTEVIFIRSQSEHSFHFK